MVAIDSIRLNNVKNNKNLSFSGHNLALNPAGEKVYKFFIPKVHYNQAFIELKKFPVDENGNIDVENASDEIKVSIPKGKHVVEIEPKNIDLDAGEVLGYSFSIDGSSYLDKHRSVTDVNGKIYNVADALYTDVLETPKSIYHIVPNIFNPTLKKASYQNAKEENIDVDDRTARINHFMQYDSSIQNIIDKIPYVKKLGFRRILSTPLFGQDNISSHGYWTNNPYQITQQYGTINDFARLQVELFKNSMGYIADGAFTNEGLSGIHIRDILRNGGRSPFKNWFQMFNYPDTNLKLGVLPDTQKGYENVDIRVVNSPVIWAVDKNGKPTVGFGYPNSAYNPEKETYVQIYDKRLTSQDQLQKDEIFYSYDIRNTQNPEDISDWMDSVRPYAFPVNPNLVIKKARAARADSSVLPKNYLVKWDNFELSTAKDSGGILLWTGNKDIPKLRFVLSDVQKQAIYDNAPSLADAEKQIQEIQQATEQVQDYIVGVGKFWTNKTAKILREHISNELSGAKTPEEFKKLIAKKAGKTLPESMKYLTTVQIQNALNDNNSSINNLNIPFNIQEALEEYPLEALEVGDDLSSIMAYPEFKFLFGVSMMPKMESYTAKLLRVVDSETSDSRAKFFGDEGVSPEGMKLLQLVSDDIKRFLLLKSLSPELKLKDILSYDQASMAKLKNITAAKLDAISKNPNDSIAKVISAMQRNFAQISTTDTRDLIEYIDAKTKNISNEAIKVADLIIEKSEAGLNWRIDAAKDIADIENFTEGEASVEETWQQVQGFWKKFNDGVKLYNNHSYKIGEFTDTAVPYNDRSLKMQNSGDIEQKIIEQGGFTTQSNYSYLFDLLQKYYSGMAEYGYDVANTPASALITSKFFDGWNGVPGYMYSGNKNNIVFSHAAVGNHDKQRIAHTFSLNSLLVYKNYRDDYGNQAWTDTEKAEIMKDLLDSSINYSSYSALVAAGNFDSLFHLISPKNLAKFASYTDAMKKALDKTNLSDDDKNNVLAMFTKALEALASTSSDKSNKFFYNNFEATYEDILDELKANNSSVVSVVSKLQPVVHDKLTEPARQRGIELAKLMVALPGNPTLYSGDELLEMGGEEKSKNFSFQNRNRLHWENLKNTDYSHVKKHVDALAKIYNLRNDASLTSLVNGDTVFLKKQGDKAGRDVIGMYRYNDKDDAIILMHNIGYNSYRNFVPNEEVQISKIDLSQSNDDRIGLPAAFKLPKGTRFVNALDFTQKFVVKEDGNLYSLKGEPITLNSSVVILKRA